MSDIFISYNHKDNAKAALYAHAIEQQGWSVFWDRDIPPGQTFDQYIGDNLEAAKCVVVLWSEHSVKSDWVKEEAASGVSRKMLIPILVSPVSPPLGFGRIEAAQLVNWAGDTAHPEFQNLIKAIGLLVEREGDTDDIADQTPEPVKTRTGSNPVIPPTAAVQTTASAASPTPAGGNKLKKIASGVGLVAVVLVALFFVRQGWLDSPKPAPPLQLSGYGVMFGSDREIKYARDEIRRATSKGIPGARLFYRNGYYASIAVTDDKETAANYLRIAKTFRDDAYIANIKTWCKNPQRREGFIECE